MLVCVNSWTVQEMLVGSSLRCDRQHPPSLLHERWVYSRNSSWHAWISQGRWNYRDEDVVLKVRPLPLASPVVRLVFICTWQKDTNKSSQLWEMEAKQRTARMLCMQLSPRYCLGCLMTQPLCSSWDGNHDRPWIWILLHLQYLMEIQKTVQANIKGIFLCVPSLYEIEISVPRNLLGFETYFYIGN